jgi:hypothetical protein
VPTALIDIFGDENVSIFLLFISARTTLPWLTEKSNQGKGVLLEVGVNQPLG